jgi:hypothetical protein
MTSGDLPDSSHMHGARYHFAEPQRRGTQKHFSLAGVRVLPAHAILVPAQHHCRHLQDLPESLVKGHFSACFKKSLKSFRGCVGHPPKTR